MILGTPVIQGILVIPVPVRESQASLDPIQGIQDPQAPARESLDSQNLDSPSRDSPSRDSPSRDSQSRGPQNQGFVNPVQATGNRAEEIIAAKPKALPATV